MTDIELVELPGSGRTFTAARTVSIADVSPDGRMRFDSIARFLGDIGNDDTDDAGFAAAGLAWVARRCTIEITEFPQSREELTMTTWCSGTGSRWAERRTNVVGSESGQIRASALWVHLDPESGRPTPWNDAFGHAYLEASQGRKVDSKLRLSKRAPDIDDGVNVMPWRFRTTDMDTFRHVNNAAYLAVLEEALGDATPPAPLAITIEWQRPAVAGPELQVVEQFSPDGITLWVTSDQGVHCTINARPL